MPKRAPLPYADYDPARCLNCDARYPTDTRFCPRCGQPNRTHKRSLLEWLSEGLSSFFHFEGRIWNTLRDLYVPGRVARNYLNGQRQRYVHPLRLLLFSSLLLLLCVQLVDRVDTDGEGAESEGFELVSVDDDESAVEDADEEDRGGGDDDEEPGTLPFGVAPDDAFTEQMRSIDQLRMHLSVHDRLRSMADSARAGGLVATAPAARLLDTFMTAFPEPTDTLLAGDFFGRRIAIGNRELAALSPEEAVTQTGVTSWWERIVLSKTIDILHDGEESISAYLLSTLSWAILFFVPILALGYYALYWRRLPYYAQHLAVVAIMVSALLIAGTVVLLVTSSLPHTSWLAVGLPFAALGYVYYSEIRVYEYAWWKTLLKGFALLVYGSVAMGLAVLLWIGLALLLR